MTVTDAPVTSRMSRPVRTISADASVVDAHKILRERALSALAVVDASGEAVGVLSRTDLLRLGRSEVARVRRAPLLSLPDVSVREVMHAGLFTVRPEATVRDAARAMVEKHVHRVFVKGDGPALEGVVSTLDLMHAVAEGGPVGRVGDFMTTPVVTIGAHQTLARATDALADAGVSGVVVVDEEGDAVGLFTQVEALQTREWASSTPVEDAMNLAVLSMSVRAPMRRAAAAAAEMRARRVVAVEHREVRGLLTGIDFARAALV